MFVNTVQKLTFSISQENIVKHWKKLQMQL